MEKPSSYVKPQIQLIASEPSGASPSSTPLPFVVPCADVWDGRVRESEVFVAVVELEALRLSGIVGVLVLAGAALK